MQTHHDRYHDRIQVDNGSEFISKVLDKRAYENSVVLDFSRKGKPTDNPFIESFNGNLRDECLNSHRFLSLLDAREKIETWREEILFDHIHHCKSYRRSSLGIGTLKPKISTYQCPGFGEALIAIENPNWLCHFLWDGYTRTK